MSVTQYNKDGVENLDNLKAWLELRQFGYLFLAECFLIEPTASWSAFYKGHAALAGLCDYSGMSTAYDFVRAKLDALAISADEVEQSAKIFERLYDAPCEDAAPPWESVYVGEGDTLMNAVTLSVLQDYHTSGYHYRFDQHQPCDHIGLELLFLSQLAQDAIAAVTELDYSALYHLLERQQHFITKHLCAFAEAFAKQTASVEGAAWYAAVAELMTCFVMHDKDRLDIFIDKNTDNRSHMHPDKHDVLRAEKQFVIPFDGIKRFVVYCKSESIDSVKKTVVVAGINNCGGACSLNVDVQMGKVLNISPNTSLSAAHTKACVRGNAYRNSFLNHKRIKYPMLRVGDRGDGNYKRITWDEAITLIAEKMTSIKAAYGAESRYVNYATGVSALMRGNALAKRLLILDGGCLNYHNSYSTACIAGATPYTFGNKLSGHSPDDYIHSELIILWGHNPAATIFGHESMVMLQAAKAKGTKIIVIDPRMTETAVALADEWVPIKPTTDGALIDAMAYTIVEAGLHDQAFLDRYCIGFDGLHMPEGSKNAENYRDYLFGVYDGQRKTPAWAAAITGLDESVIHRLAMDYAKTKPAALIQGYGPQRNANGEQIVRGCNMLACLTGNVGKIGGSSGGGLYLRYNLPIMMPEIENPVKESIPCFLWTDAIERAADMTSASDGIMGAHQLKAPIKMIFNLAGNILINQHSDINRTIKLLKDPSKVEFIVCSDLFMTPSTRFADLILPGTSMFEGENIRAPWGGGNYLLYVNQCIEPLFECRFEYDWLTEVAERLNLKEAFTLGAPNMTEQLQRAYEVLRTKESELPTFDVFKREGGYVYQTVKHVIAYREQIESFETHPFETPSGKIELYSPRLDSGGDIPAIPKYTPAFEGPQDPQTEKYPYQLVGWHSKRRTHSTHDHNLWLDGVEDQQLWIHPEDARQLMIVGGETVEIYNDRGCVRVPAYVTERIARGVVGMAQGGWYRPDSKGTDLRGAMNVLTTSRPTPLVKGNPQHSNLVAVRRCGIQI
ncbi:molybdopterin-dependent oxidoreductase [Fusibacter paucivorans]|uniref:Molybdopterin-dependent oxidoreductase n=1 Tax=Fusibacter paucivorans TaxID=76009 RepID=A0ABS5PQN3_9FIRM|nr:DMSO/selenate family reductase complex A subunit [Fusibacter paucivorans]MBS7527450.1 molybdopterin-dependent oxidoreductase [Fusibacter paucivorans]